MFKAFQSQFSGQSRRKIFIVVGLLFIGLLTLGAIRVGSALWLRYKTNQRAISVVATVAAKPGSNYEKIVLPGNVRAWHEAPIYARANGYIKQWYVDIGDQVKEGDLLAEIETPELDAQLHQAEADLQVVIANHELAQSTAIRWVALLKTDSVSKQETDEKVDTEKALKASVIAARANYERLKELVGFERVIAPFTGTISSRATDIGALINAGSNPIARPLFRIVQSDPLRIYVEIPQNYSSRITPNMVVSLHFAEHPGKSFPAKLLKTAEAINPKTRTLLAQFKANNPAGELLPGGYTEVHFNMPHSPQAVRVPVNTLLFRSEGIQVASVNKQGCIVLKKITISRDFGKEVEIDTGLKPGEHVILNPPDSLYDGQKVRVAAGRKKK